MQKDASTHRSRIMCLASAGVLGWLATTGIACGSSEPAAGSQVGQGGGAATPGSGGASGASAGNGGTTSPMGGAGGSISTTGGSSGSSGSDGGGVIDPDASCANDNRKAGLVEVNM